MSAIDEEKKSGRPANMRFALSGLVLGLLLGATGAAFIECRSGAVPPEHAKRVFLDKSPLRGLILSGTQGDMIAWDILGRDNRWYSVINGNLHDDNGQNLTAANQWRLATDTPTATAPETLSSDDLLALSRDVLKGFDHFGGDRPLTIFGFVDPDCGVCKTAMNTVDQLAREFRDAGADIRWLPVTILTDDRAKAGRMILHGRAGLDAAGDPGGEILNQVDINTAALAHSLQEPVVPYFIWEAEDGVNAYIGEPSARHWQMILASLQGKETSAAKGSAQ